MRCLYPCTYSTYATRAHFPNAIYLSLDHSYFTLSRPQKGNVKPSPSLTYPDLVSDNKSGLKALPNSFLGGFAPGIQSFQSTFIHIPGNTDTTCLGIFPYLVYSPKTIGVLVLSDPAQNLGFESHSRDPFLSHPSARFAHLAPDLTHFFDRAASAGTSSCSWLTLTPLYSFLQDNVFSMNSPLTPQSFRRVIDYLLRA